MYKIQYLHDKIIDESIVNLIYDTGLISVDIETTGLDWRKDTIELCQIYIPNNIVLIVKPKGRNIDILRKLISDSNICKIFHHAMFDLRFMRHHWSVIPSNITCTKICSKIIYPNKEFHNLKNLLKEIFNLSIDKKMQTSNWKSNILSNNQINYAVNDVIFLPDLFMKLKEILIQKESWSKAELSFAYIPTRVELDIQGVGDVFTY